MDKTCTPLVQTLPQLARGAPWRTGLPHPVATPMLIWITRGQGRVLIQGIRRGIGTHNALFLPAGSLFSIEPGPQGFGQVVSLPVDDPAIALPDAPIHLRLRDAQQQAALNAILDTLQRELTTDLPFGDEAARAQLILLTVWLRRAILTSLDPLPKTAASRLTQAFCALLVRDFRTGQPMADYAGALGVTPTHLTRSLKECSGHTAADLINRVTLHAARDLIETTKYPLRRIASHLGFGSAAYFSRFIQSHTGKSPSGLRQDALRHLEQSKIRQTGRK